MKGKFAILCISVVFSTALFGQECDSCGEQEPQYVTQKPVQYRYPTCVTNRSLYSNPYYPEYGQEREAYWPSKWESSFYDYYTR